MEGAKRRQYFSEELNKSIFAARLSDKVHKAYMLLCCMFYIIIVSDPYHFDVDPDPDPDPWIRIRDD